MRRNSRIKGRYKKTSDDKLILYTIIGISVLLVVLLGLLFYTKNLNDNVTEGTMDLEKVANMTENNITENNTESASTEMGKTVEEVKNESKPQEEANANATNNQTTENKSNNVANTTENNDTAKNNTTNKNTETKNDKKEEKKQEPKQELSFAKPVDGEITKGYAKDNLVYSETLKEWVTHLGVDIKADKTSVVKSAEAGTVKSIKNDPRYGLTVVIDHADGYQTVYSNLLTAEFVVEGEKIEKGQSIGTVGNTAIFEVADEPHLHFEILKDSVQIDPTIYLK